MELFIPILFLTLTSFVSAQNMKPAQPNAKFSEMSDRFVKDSLVLSPVSASQAGYHKHTDPATGKTIDLDAQLDDVGPQGFAAQEKFYSDWRTRFQTETPVASLNPQDAADFRLIDDQIALKLLEFQKIQNYKHNPTVYVELLGNALFLPLTQNYDTKEVRLGHVISRIGQIPRFLDQAKSAARPTPTPSLSRPPSTRTTAISTCSTPSPPRFPPARRSKRNSTRSLPPLASRSTTSPPG